MTQENFEYLKNQVKYTGFGDALEFALKEEMAKGAEKFQLQHTAEFGKDKVTATLNFAQSEKGEKKNYFLNNYDMVLEKEGAEPMKQRFLLYGAQAVDKQGENGEIKKEWINSNITFKEGYNLMDGRSVFKDFVSKEKEKYSAWVSLDMKNTDEHGNFKQKKTLGFDLAAKLAEYPIKELGNEKSRQELLESLQKGNRAAVTMVSGGTEERRFIEANPLFKGIKQFEGNQRVSAHQEQGKEQGQQQGQSVKDTAKEQEAEKNNETRQRHGRTVS